MPRYGLMLAIGLPLAAVVLIAGLAIWAGARNLRAISGEDEAGCPLGPDRLPGPEVRTPDHPHVYDEDGDCTVCGHDMWTPRPGVPLKRVRGGHDAATQREGGTDRG